LAVRGSKEITFVIAICGDAVAEINSNAYWDARFGGDWQASHGSEQSRFFSNVALRALPEWMTREIRRDRLTIADWGCGEGDGTDVWAACASVEQITGVDFSTVAIDTAKKRYPQITFFAENWLSPDSSDRHFDVVYSSNVVEHFHDPRKVLRTLCQRAKRAIILALPYRESSRIDEHFFTFTPNNIPLSLDNGFRLVFSKVIDCSKLAESYWRGEQIILIYINSSWGDALNLTLNESLTESDAKDAELESLKSSVIEKEERIARLIVEQNEREKHFMMQLRDAQNELIAERGNFHEQLIELQRSNILEVQEAASSDTLLDLNKKTIEVERKWSEKYIDREAQYFRDYQSLSSSLNEIQKMCLSLEREKIKQIDFLVNREREAARDYVGQISVLQTQLSAMQGELRSAEHKWMRRSREQDVLYAAKYQALQTRLDHSQQLCVALAREKDAQTDVFARRSEELRASLETQAVEQTKVFARDVELMQMSMDLQKAEQSEIFAKQIFDAERAHTDRERELRACLRSMDEEFSRAKESWRESSERQASLYEEKYQAFQSKIDDLQRLNSDQQREALETQKVQAERELHAVEALKAREHELTELMQGKDRAFVALTAYTKLLEDRQESIEKSWFLRLVAYCAGWDRLASMKARSVHAGNVENNVGELGFGRSLIELHEEKNSIGLEEVKAMVLQYEFKDIQDIKTADDLLALEGVEFVEAAYRVLLNREPDQDGLSYYFNRLRNGVGKIEILSQLRLSDEAKSSGPELPRLNELIFREKWSRLPLLGWLTPRAERLQYKVRAIEHRLAEIRQATADYMPRLEREIAEKGMRIEDSSSLIEALRQQIAAKDAELSGVRTMLYETNDRLDQLMSARDISWVQFNAQILSHRDKYKGVFVQQLVIDWNIPLYQRPQHIATAFGRLGYLVIFRTDNWAGDDVKGFRQITENVWLTNSPEVCGIQDAVFSFYSTAYANTPAMIRESAKNGVVVYEYIDHIDPMISGEPENIRRLLALKEHAFSGGAHFIVASAKKLQEEAIEAVGRERVILAQNGVDTAHYRNPVHDHTLLPESLLKFRKKYKKIVGYFGAMAPWLWYEAITQLTEARQDIGFLFIGPDYYGGASKLPSRENFLYMGPIDYKILPAYSRQFDVCLIPFSPGEIAKTTSPLKLFEYFALEKPVVVTSDMQECVAFPEVFSGSSAQGLEIAIDKAFAVKDDDRFRERLSVLADQNDWIERARAMEQVFDLADAKQ
jgi:SAM-dependent methyltransferase